MGAIGVQRVKNTGLNQHHHDCTIFVWAYNEAQAPNIRECDSALYVGLARAVSPSNTNFRLTFLLIRLQEALYEDISVYKLYIWFSR